MVQRSAILTGIENVQRTKAEQLTQHVKKNACLYSGIACILLLNSDVR